MDRGGRGRRDRRPRGRAVDSPRSRRRAVSGDHRPVYRRRRRRRAQHALLARRDRRNRRSTAPVASLVSRGQVRRDRDHARRPGRTRRRVPAPAGRSCRCRARGREPMTVLVTGFEPFGGSATNPSQRIVHSLDGVEKALLPVSYARAADELRRAVRGAAPDVVICFGQADGRAQISLERFAHNLDEASTVDNDELTGSGAPIDPSGPAAYSSTLPVDDIVAALRADGIPAAPSRDAAGFLCNHVFYLLMRVLEQERTAAIGGFVHVPLLPEQALEKDAPTMPLETQLRAAQAIVGCVS